MSESKEIEVWVVMDKLGNYEVGCEQEDAMERLDEKGGSAVRRFVRIVVTMAPPDTPTAVVEVPDDAGQTFSAKVT
jgi:hypothetical protein